MDRRPGAPEHDLPTLAAGPFGPWALAPGDEDGATGTDPDEIGFGGMADGWEEDDGRPAVTGPALDEFLPIYWLLGHPTKHRPAYTADDADRLDLAVVATLLGVRPDTPDDPFGPLSGDYDADAARLLARRVAEARSAQQAEGAPQG